MKTRQPFSPAEYLVVALTLVLMLMLFVGVLRVAPAQRQPGDANEVIHLASQSTATNPQRWVPINGQYIGSDLLLSPEDSLTKWTGSTVTTANFSFAVLPIADPNNR
jgi:hypothetical protein